MDNTMPKGFLKEFISSMRLRLLCLLGIWLAGIILILIVAANYKSRSANRPCVVASQLLISNKPAALLEEIRRTDLWAPLFPAIKIRRQLCAIRCHVRLSDVVSAEKMAEEILDSSYDKISRSGISSNNATRGVFLLERFACAMEKPFDWLIDGAYRKENVGLGYSNWSGYDVLAQELKYINDTNGLAQTMKAITARDPGNSLAGNIDSFLRSSAIRAMQAAEEAIRSAPSGWAIVKTSDAKSYTRQGKFADYVKRGTLLEISRITNSASGEIVLGTIHAIDQKVPNVVMMAADLDLRKGSFANVCQSTRDCFMERCILIKELDDLKARLSHESDRQNPNFSAYSNARQNLRTFGEKANAIKARFRAATGEERDALSNTLREMKSEGVKLEEVFAAARHKYLAWKAEMAPKIENTSELSTLQQKLAAVEAKLRAMKQL